jgi:hypothetical protein
LFLFFCFLFFVFCFCFCFFVKSFVKSCLFTNLVRYA